MDNMEMKPTDDVFAGVDLGGTKTLAILMDSSGIILARGKMKTDASKELGDVASAVRRLVESMLKPVGMSVRQLAAVGVAIPGGIDPATGDVLCAANLGWRNLPARKTFSDAFERDVFLGNDVNCGILGERQFGAARGMSNVVGFFVGTGLGGGVILNGRLVQGVKGVAGEFGHMNIKPGGRLCSCGKKGCLEAYCSKVAFAKKFQRMIGLKGRKSLLLGKLRGDYSKIKSAMLGELYRSGDEVVVQVLNNGARSLGLATATVMAILGPECVVYGGGVIEELGAELLPEIRKGIEPNLFGLAMDDVKTRVTELKGDAGALGAGYLAMTRGDV